MSKASCYQLPAVTLNSRFVPSLKETIFMKVLSFTFSSKRLSVFQFASSGWLPVIYTFWFGEGFLTRTWKVTLCCMWELLLQPVKMKIKRRTETIKMIFFINHSPFFKEESNNPYKIPAIYLLKQSKSDKDWNKNHLKRLIDAPW